MAKSQRGAARFQPAVRNQIEWQPLSLEDLVSPDHSARLVLACVESLVHNLQRQWDLLRKAKLAAAA